MNAVMSLEIKNTGKAPGTCPYRVTNAAQTSVRRSFFFEGQGIPTWMATVAVAYSKADETRRLWRQLRLCRLDESRASTVYITILNMDTRVPRS
jgi:hypothetical protein